MREAFRLGYEAFFEGVLECPFRGMLKKEWDRGFNAAYSDNLRGRYVQSIQQTHIR